MEDENILLIDRNINKNQIIKEDEFNLNEYYSINTPYNKILLATGVSLAASYSTSIIATGLSSSIIIWGHVFFSDTAFLIATGAKAVTGIGLIIAIPCLIGGISYNIYKYIKSKKQKEFMEKLANLEDETMKEEREIYLKIFNEFKVYFQNKLKVKFNSIEAQIKHYCNKIIQSINGIMKLFRKKELEKEKKEIKNKIEKIISLNILIIGNTGVGKSTLINEFLKLEKNKSEEGKGHKPMKIDFWPKKYPIYEDDSPIKNINLYDTEGIEKSCKYGNDINSHFLKVKKFLEDKNNKINALWYCVNDNRLDGDEEYINKILSLNEMKIPIIFIYTKAYSNKEEDIETIEEGLKQFEYFKGNKDKFHFVEVISRDYVDRKGETKEKNKGLKELLDLTISLSENSFKYQFYKIINEYYNQKDEIFINNLSNQLKEQFSNIITKKEKDNDNFKKYINDLFNCSYGDYLKIRKDEIIGNYCKTPLCSENENEIDITYKSVEKMLETFETTKDN